MAPATRMDCGRSVRSARKPPSGTETTASHNTMLMADPAAVIDQPRSTSIDRPETEDHRKADVEEAPDQPRDDHGEHRAAVETCGGCGARRHWRGDR